MFYILLVNFLLLHPVHLTVTNIEFLPQKKYFIIQVRFFVDDLQGAILRETGQKIVFKNTKNKQDKELLNRYIRNNLKIVVDGYDLSKNYIIDKYVLEDITLWLYMHAKYKNTHFKSVKIINSLITNLYPDQQNLLIFVYKNQEKGLTFNSKKKQILLTH